jgi:hypothetical protein
MLTNSSFLLIYKPIFRRVPRMGRVWLTHAHIQAFQTPPTVNVTRPKWPSWASPITKACRPRPSQRAVFIQTCVMWAFTRLFSKYITRACGANFHAPFTRPQTKPRALNTASTPPNLLQQVPKIRLCGTLSNMQLGMNDCAMYKRGA